MNTKEIAAQIYKKSQDKTLDRGEFLLEVLSLCDKDEARKVLKEYQNIMSGNLKIAEIVSAQELDLKIKEKVQKFIEEKFEKSDLIFIFDVDPTILGGFVAKVGDKILDESLVNRVANL